MSGLAWLLFAGVLVGGLTFAVLLLGMLGIPLPPALWGLVA